MIVILLNWCCLLILKYTDNTHLQKQKYHIPLNPVYVNTMTEIRMLHQH
jgi:hypothetical protein